MLSTPGMKGREMDTQEIIACIAKPEDAPEIRRLLASVGVTTALKIPKGDIEARLSLTTLGLTLIFKPEGPKSSRLILDTVMFVSDAEEGYSTYPGVLPEGLLFSDTQAEAHAKLGPPAFSKPKLRFDIWERPPVDLSINYTKALPQRIGVVSVDRAEKD